MLCSHSKFCTHPNFPACEAEKFVYLGRISLPIKAILKICPVASTRSAGLFLGSICNF